MGLLDTANAIRQDVATTKQSKSRQHQPEHEHFTKKIVKADLRAVPTEEPAGTTHALKALLETLAAEAILAAQAGKRLKLRKLTKKLGGKKMVKLLDQTLAQLVKDKQTKELVRNLVGPKQFRKISRKTKKLAKKVAESRI